MPHDRLNVFDPQMRFKRFLALRYPASLGPGFHRLAVRPTADGALLHVLIVMNNDLPDDATQIHVSFNHYAPCSRRG